MDEWMNRMIPRGRGGKIEGRQDGPAGRLMPGEGGLMPVKGTAQPEAIFIAPPDREKQKRLPSPCEESSRGETKYPTVPPGSGRTAAHSMRRITGPGRR